MSCDHCGKRHTGRCPKVRPEGGVARTALRPYPHGRRPTEADVIAATDRYERYELMADQSEWDERER
jgi:endonuclease YncB( thermonuclease family)